MIYEALTCLSEEINEYFRNKLKISDDRVVLSGIINQDGTVAIQGENKVLLTLINIEKEPVSRINNTSLKAMGNTSPPTSVNLYILFSAYFSANNYAESLRFISFIIAFLQEKNVFTSANTPRLDDAIERLSVEMESVGSEKLNNIWATLGAKYMPSVLYKVRMLTYDGTNIKAYTPLISSASDGK